MDNIEFLGTVKMLAGLGLPELVKLQARCRADKCGEGERISVEGQAADDFFLLKEGRVELRYELPGRESSSEQALSVIEPGGAWGWSALVPPHVYTLSAYCIAPRCVFLRFRREDLLGLFESDWRMGYFFMRNLATIIAQRFNAVQDELARQQGFDQMHQW